MSWAFFLGVFTALKPTLLHASATKLCLCLEAIQSQVGQRKHHPSGLISGSHLVWFQPCSQSETHPGLSSGEWILSFSEATPSFL